MAKDNSLFVILGLGALGWYAYTQGWLSSFFAPAAAASIPVVPSSVPTTTTPTCAAPNVLVNGVCTAPAVTQGTNPPTITQYNGPGASTAAQALLASQLAGLSPSNTLNIDQWAYYYAQLPAGSPITLVDPGAPGGTITVPSSTNNLSGSQINAILAAAGASDANRSTVMMTAPQFVNLLSTAGGVTGLSGYSAGYRRRILVPIMLTPGRGFGAYDIGDLRRAGGR